MFRIKGLDPTLKVLAVPAIAILGSLLLAVYIFLNGYPKITSGIEDINESKKVKNSLEERLGVLQDFNKGVLSNQSDVVFTVLPNKNSGASLVAQVKTMAVNNGLTLTQVSSTGSDKFRADIFRSNLDFIFNTGDMNSAVKFLKDLGNIAPISSIEVADMAIVEGGIQVKLKAAIYWSDLPTKLPDISQPLTELTAKDRETLKAVQSYKLPKFVDLSPQDQNKARTNPFN